MLLANRPISQSTMCFTPKNKGKATGAGVEQRSPPGGAGKDDGSRGEEANTTIIDSEGRKTTDAYDEVCRCAD